MLERAKENRNPFLYAVFEEVAPVISGLRSVDRDQSWQTGAFRFLKRLDHQGATGRVSLRIRDFGLRSTAEEWVEAFTARSTNSRSPARPLVCVNGVDDSVFPIADMYLLLEHGSPKAARFYSGGHMGGGHAQAVIIQWLKEKLR